MVEAQATKDGRLKIVNVDLIFDDVEAEVVRAANHLPLNLPRTWRLGNAVINRLLHTPQGLSLVGWNDAAHLDTLARDETAT